MNTQLLRNDLRQLYRVASDAHPGLLLQHGLETHKEGGEAKTKFIERVCKTSIGDFYRNAYNRWREATSDKLRFRSTVLRLETRLFAGLTGGGMLETGCTISHSYGAPYIPGSSVKGIVNAHVREKFHHAEGGAAICNEIFGAPATNSQPAGLAGLVSFHDAWWVPSPDQRPLVPEIVTTHHPDYYGKDGQEPATDFDSPVPNAQIAVQGAFLFVLEGPPAWLDLAEKMMVDALSIRGAGAKTGSGYGLFEPKAAVEPETSCAWVDETIAALSSGPTSNEEETLRGKQLARDWSKIEDSARKDEAYRDIRSRWEKEGWWETPPGKAARAAKAIYDEHQPD